MLLTTFLVEAHERPLEKASALVKGTAFIRGRLTHVV